MSDPEHPTGLYSATLFDYNQRMQNYFDNGLELGRSFVQPKYWGNRSLDYLWCGIGAFVSRYPKYRYLFGPVSIPGTFPQTAVTLLVDFYKCYYSNSELLASAKIPVLENASPVYEFDGNDYEKELLVLKELLAHMNVKIPTLLKQYGEVSVAGGSSYLAFNRDPDFNDCIDGLVMVDITKLRPKKRKRYFKTAAETTKAI